MLRLVTFGLVIYIASCTDPQVFTIQPIPSQTAVVGEELQVELVLLDLGGAVPVFSLTSPTLPDLMTRMNPPRFTLFGNRGAYLRWSPLSADIGTHQMTLTAAGTEYAATQTFTVEITSGNAAPIFLKPLGAGMTLDLSRDTCFNIDIEVQDTDTVAGLIELESPIPEGYELVRTGDWSATFRWCPSTTQVNAQTRYRLNLLADDSDGHVTRKTYTLILRDAIGDNCDGRAPRIEHMPPTEPLTANAIELRARVTDDLGIGAPPTVYYREKNERVVDDRDLDSFLNAEMVVQSGTPVDGLYVATIPLSNLSESASLIEYFIEVRDNDDPLGNCDHRTTSPNQNLHNLSVSNTRVDGTLDTCARCTTDTDCISGFCAKDNEQTGTCLDRCGGERTVSCQTHPKGGCCGETLIACSNGTAMNTPCNGPCGWNASASEYSCTPTHPADPTGVYPNACLSTTGCDERYSCSDRERTSASGQRAQVCEPISGSCAALCTDDDYEPNDTVDTAQTLPSANATLSELKLCGLETESSFDYFNVFLETEGDLRVTASFMQAQGDLDLTLISAQDDIIAYDWSITDNEEIDTCLEQGTYTIQAFSATPLVEIPYTLDVNFRPSSCCQVDTFEPNDTLDDAQLIFAGDTFNVLSICRGDLDIFLIDLVAGDTLVVDLLFDQERDQDDLDVFIHDSSDVRLTPCCDLDNGQSITPDEHLEFTAAVNGRYAIVVEGYMSSQNEYLLGVDIQ